MRKILICVLAIALLISNMPVFAAQGRRGASDKALESASDEAVFHRVGDWFATRGKTEKEKKAIITKRKAERKVARAKKEVAKRKRKMEKKSLKAKKKAQNKTKRWMKKSKK